MERQYQTHLNSTLHVVLRRRTSFSVNYNNQQKQIKHFLSCGNFVVLLEHITK